MALFASRRGFSQACRVTVVVVSAVLVVTFVGDVNASAAPPPVADKKPAAKADVPRVTVADDPVSARIAARTQKARVEVASARTETLQTFINADGTTTVQAATGPVRVHRDDGSWAPIDLGLVQGKDGWSPTSSPAPVTFSSGGDSILATLDIGERALRMHWPVGSLPKPTVAGGVATYALTPNQDLVVTATSTGFEQSLVIKAPPAVADPVRLVLPLDVDGVELKTDKHGGYVLGATKASGKGKDKIDVGDAVGEIPAPVMFSAAKDAKTGEHTQVGTLDTAVTDRADGKGPQLSLTPSMDFLTDPKTVYPVTIDPVIASVTSAGDTWVRNGDGTAHGSDTQLSTGLWTSGAMTNALALMKFNIGSFAGNHVTNASLSLFNSYTGSCNADGVGIYPVGQDFNPATVTYATRPNKIDNGGVWKAFGHGFDASCPAAAEAFDVTDMVSQWSWGQLGNYGFQVESDISNANMRKTFCSMDISGTVGNVCSYAARVPTLSVTYNTYPWPPQDVTHSPKVLGTTGSTYSTSITPTISAMIGNTDGTPITLTAEVSHDPNYSAEGTGVVWTGATSGITPGSVGQVKVPPATLPVGNHLRYRVIGSVPVPGGGTDWSAWSGYQQMVMNSTPPAAPTIACPSYPANTWTGSAGTVTCSLSTASTDGSGYYWALDNPTPNTVVENGTNSGTTQSFTMNPAVGFHTLYARTRDTALNLSTATTKYTFGVGSGGVVTPAGGAQTQKAVPLTAQSKSLYTQVSYSYRAGTDSALPWISIPVANVTTPGSSTPIAPWPQIGTVSGSITNYTQLNWNVAATIAAAGGADGPIQVRACFTQPGQTAYCDNGNTFTLAKTSFSPTAATAPIGPGTVSLVTGDFAVDESDVSIAGLSIARTHTSLSPAGANTGPAGVFGPGWTVSAFGPPAGAGDMTLDDQSAKGYVVLSDSSGTKSTYVKNGAVYNGIADATDGSTLVKSTTIKNPVDTSDVTNYTGWQLTDLDGTVTSYLQLGTSSTYLSKWINEAGKESESTYTRDANGRITKILAPVPAGVTCTTMVAGCQALNITYATTTTATGTAQANWGDYAGLVKTITYTGYDPATSAMVTTPIAVSQYQYDNTGHLRAQWDPRISPGLATTYGYWSDGRIATVDNPGRAIWIMGYDNTGRLNNAARTDPANGNAQYSVAYDIPLSGTNTPIDMSAAQTATWNQTTDLPFTGAGVWSASWIPSSNTNGVLTPSGDDWVNADLVYIDTEGRPVNTASFGAGAWQINTTRHDPTTGNTLWELSDRNRAQALTPTGDTDPFVAAQTSPAVRADLLATQSVYSSDGVDLLSTSGPTHPVYVASGALSSVRVKTSNTYDQGAPAGGPYHLATTTTTASIPQDGTLTSAADTITRLTGYDPIDGASSTGPTSGWILKRPTVATTVMGTSPGANDITTKTRYDDAGRVLETRMPLSTGTDAGTTVATYYTAAANATTPACGNKPQWAGARCKSEPKAQPGGTTIPSGVTTYTIWGATDTVVETSGTTTRTSDTDYDSAGRPTITSLVVSPAADGGTALPNVSIVYSPTSGDPTSVTSGGSTISTVTNTLGQQTSYTDADGQATTMTYTLDGQLKTRSDGKGTYTYTYDGIDADGAAERRGLLTSLNVGMGAAPSVFTAAYDAGGNLVKEVYPNTVTAVTSYDNIDDARRLAYSKNGFAWMTYDTGSDRDGHTVYATSPMSLDHYGYDNASRLTFVSDSVAGTCTTRQYAFSKNGNRAGLTTGAAPDTAGTCQTSTTTTASNSFDTADRITNSGYTYDKFGRTLTVPTTDVTGGATLTNAYYADDKVALLTQGTKTKAFTLDPVRRLRQVTDKTSGTETRRIINHYADTGDSPVWIATSTDAGTSYTWDRNVQGIDGSLAAIQSSTGVIQLQLTNLHGDIVATVANDPNAVATNAYFEQTEYGTPRTQNTANPGRYGWLGAKQRSVDSVAGLTLMGVRLYNPAVGRFLSRDAISGGNENSYNYPNDPVNSSDVSGLSGKGDFHDAERKLCRKRIWQCHDYLNIIAEAGAYTKARYGTQNGPKANAFRHMLYSALLTAFFGVKDAHLWESAHESGSSPGDLDHIVDLRNNSMGEAIGKRVSGVQKFFMGIPGVAYKLNRTIAEYIRGGWYWRQCHHNTQIC